MLSEITPTRLVSRHLVYRLVLAITIVVTIAIPALTVSAAPGHNPSYAAVSQQDDSPPIVPREGSTAAEADEPKADTTATDQTAAMDIEVELDNDTPDDPSDDVVEVTFNRQEPVQPVTFSGIIPAAADLQPNQWMGAMDGRLVEPFATPLRPTHVQSDAIGLDAEITVREIVNGEMQTPADETEVTWYKETGSPGVRGTNVVLAGHLNWYNTPYAVFHNIDELKEGDLIVVTGEDGFEYTYQVRWVKLFDDANADMEALVGPTEKSSLTLITCGGEWDADAGQYGKRTVVRAQIVS
jgi:LPXTG-site transpeptidase (sortase) family protein